MKGNIIFSCEHGGNQVPAEYQFLFKAAETDLNSHLGFDPGASGLYHIFRHTIPSQGIISEISRLFVELNRNQGHPRVFSKYSRVCSPTERSDILLKYYTPYREELSGLIASSVKSKVLTIHISVHSFTPELLGKIRNADVGLLYDPFRLPEKTFCAGWKFALNNNSPLRVRFNYPYLGRADGLTTWFRKMYNPHQYLGIELEVNQKLLKSETTISQIGKTLAISLETMLS